MNETIHVEIDGPCDADDLVAFLATLGLAGSVTGVDDHREVEVGFAVSPDLQLRRQVEAALTRWLELRSEPLVPIAVDDHDYVLRPPAG